MKCQLVIYMIKLETKVNGCDNDLENLRIEKWILT